MLQFEDLTIGDKPWVDELLGYSDFMGAEFCFTTLFIWQKVYNSKALRYKDFFLLKSNDPEDEAKVSYLYPTGKGDLKEALEIVIDDAGASGRKCYISTIPSTEISKIEELFPGKFEFFPIRQSFDYIYDRESLATLSGKKYQSKRNHIARFKELPGWEYESISAVDNGLWESQIADCVEMNKEWCKINQCYDNYSLHNEACAASRALRYFKELNLRGAILRLDNRVVAFTLGEAINSDTFLVHVEKAFSDIRGAYPFINQQFVLHETDGYKYINREDDSGDEGLRKAKESYHPIFMYEKYIAKEK